MAGPARNSPEGVRGGGAELGRKPGELGGGATQLLTPVKEDSCKGDRAVPAMSLLVIPGVTRASWTAHSIFCKGKPITAIQPQWLA